MDPVKQIRVLLAEDHSVVRRGIRNALEQTPEIVLVGEAESGEQALALAKELHPDVLLCDVRLPALSGIEVALRVRECSPQTRTLMLSAFDDDEYVFEAMASGACGYLLKTMDATELPEAVHRANRGETVLYPPLAGKLARLLGGTQTSAKEPLTPREREIMTLATRGLKNRAIAKKLNLSVRTVEGHASRIFVKLSVSSRLEAINACLSKRLIDAGKDQSG